MAELGGNIGDIDLNTQSDFGGNPEINIGAANGDMPIFKFDDEPKKPKNSASNETYLKKEFNGPTTLDEPVLDTIVSKYSSSRLNSIKQKRDLYGILRKVKITFLSKDQEEKTRELKKYDLWGPFLFTLIYAL